MSTRPSVAFLFGSGISLPAGYPSTQAITDRVLSGRGVIRHTDGTYYFSNDHHPGLPSDYLPRVRAFLTILLREARSYYSRSSQRTVNYEDLAFMASQIADSESWEYDNPVVQPMVDRICPEVTVSLQSTEAQPTYREWSMWRIAEESLNYIKDVVWRSLDRPSGRFEHLGILDSAYQHFPHLNVFTLNHDTLIEQALYLSGIPYYQGFGAIENDVRYWDQRELCSNSTGVHLFKLHGSVDWFRFRPDGGSFRNDRVGIPQQRDIWHTESPSGEQQLPGDGRPVFLVGTFNKILNYTSPIYNLLHCAFVERLQTTTDLVVCGYSFNDKAINALIIQWMYEHNDRRLIVCHPKPDNLRDNSRGAIKHKWDSWRAGNLLVVIPKYIEQLDWSDFQDVQMCQ